MSNSALRTERDPIPVIHFGLGPIGLLIAKTVAGTAYFHSVAAIDRDPNLEGRDLGELVGDGPSGVLVTADVNAALRSDADVVLHSTVSSLSDAATQITTCVRARKRVVVSTCEELAYPWHAQPALAAEIDAAARDAQSVVVGTGVNPGFAMDYLPLVLSGATAAVRSVTIRRSQDISGRRSRLRDKLGVGLTVEEFRQLVRKGRMGHVGLRESADALAAALGWELTDVQTSIEPLLVQHSGGGATDAGETAQVTGVSQTLSAYVGTRRVLRLELQLGVAVTESIDEISIEGQPELRVLVPGGIQGDLATAALSVNTIGSAMRAAPGLRSMADLPPARFGPPWALRA